MTVELYSPPQLITVSATGPHSVPFAYAEGAVIVYVVEADGAENLLDPSAYSVEPASSQTRGNLYLNTLAPYLGKRLRILRDTDLEQGWVGLGGERERGLETQLDRTVMAVQELDRAYRSTLRIPNTDQPPLSPAPGKVLMWDDEKRIVPGPNAEDIAQAQHYGEIAADAADRAELAAGALGSAAYGDGVPFVVTAAPMTIPLLGNYIVDSVYISGLIQQRNVSWSQTGNVLTLNEPGAIGMSGWYRYRIMEGEFAGQSNTFNGRPAVVAAANSVIWPVGSIICDGTVQYRYAGSGTLISDMPGWVPHGDFVQPEHFAANTVPGTTDMLSAMQAAVDYCAANNAVMRLRNRVYAVSGEIVLKEGCRLYGSGNWSGMTFLNPTLGTTVIRYIGAGGANSCVVRISKKSVGVEGSAADNLSNVAFCNLTIDGNGIAEIGLYCNRAWSNNKLDYLTVTNTLKHGFWVGNCWNGSPTNWHAYKNIGAGITLGINTFGWTQSAVDQSVCTSFFGYYSGMALNEFVSRSVMTDADPGQEYGIGLGSHRALVLQNPQANECSGPGLFVSGSTLSPITIVGGYFENNGRSTGASRRWDMWYSPTASLLGMSMTGTHWGVAATGAIKITGTPNTGRIENALKLSNMHILPTIDADHGYYRFIDCDEDPVAIIGTPPIQFGGKINDAKNLIPLARVHFWINGTTPTVAFAEGTPVTITYNATGDYTLTLSEAQASSSWVCEAQTPGDNRYVRVADYTTALCRIYHKSLTGVASDPTAANLAIRCVIYGART